MLGMVHTSHFYCFEFNSIKCGRNAIVDWPSFFFFFGGTKFTHAQYINIMYELDWTRQKFDV